MMPHSSVHKDRAIATVEPIAIEPLLARPVEEIIALLPEFLGTYVVDEGGARERTVDEIASVVADVADWRELHAHLKVIGSDFGAWARNELAGRLAAAYMSQLVTPASSIDGFEHLDAAITMAAGRRLMLVGNHLSYADTTVLTMLLTAAGRHEFRCTISAVAGPKVYSEPLRRLAASAIGTIQVAQSASVATDGPAMSPRDVVRIAKKCLAEAAEMMDRGFTVLVYPEGTRSRSGRLGPFIRATNRWLTLPGVVVLPVAVTGTEKLYRKDDDFMHPSECHVRFGPPMDVDALRAAGADRDGVLQAARDALVSLLPEPYRPEAAAPPIG